MRNENCAVTFALGNVIITVEQFCTFEIISAFRDPIAQLVVCLLFVLRVPGSNPGRGNLDIKLFRSTHQSWVIFITFIKYSVVLVPVIQGIQYVLETIRPLPSPCEGRPKHQRINGNQPQCISFRLIANTVSNESNLSSFLYFKQRWRSGVFWERIICRWQKL